MKYFSFLQNISLNSAWLGIIMLLLLSGVTWYLSYVSGLALAYNDAMAHLNISRLVVDNITPGFSQIGGVWLPLNHVFSLPFIWHDTLWRTGLAGSIVSMLSYVISAVAIYKVIHLLTKNTIASIMGTGVFALNVNMLYLQTTPLTEPLYLLFFTLSGYYFAKWIVSKQDANLLMLGIFGFCQVLTRYDGWFVVILEGLIIAYYLLLHKRFSIFESVGKLVLFGFPILFGIGLWLLWNLLIFNDPLFFALGEYSARAQQSHLQDAVGLLTMHNPLLSILAYVYAMANNVSWYILGFSVIGIGIFLRQKVKGLTATPKTLIVLFLLTPVIFNILALYLGFSIVNLPELNWNPSPDPGGKWFNVRYGILVLPFVAIMLGIFANVKKIAVIIVAQLILLQIVLMYPQNIITITDGTVGSSSFKNHDVVSFLQQEMHPDDTILLAVSYYSPVAFQSGFSLNRVIHEGTGSIWDRALINPDYFANWIVMANGDIGEPVHTALVQESEVEPLKQYRLVFKGKHANVYKLKNKTITYRQLLSARDNL